MKPQAGSTVTPSPLVTNCIELLRTEEGACAPKDDAPKFTFTTTTGQWHIRKSQLFDLRDKFTNVHVDSELDGLIAWLEANPDRRKPPAAMWSWLRGLLAKKAGELARKGQTGPARYADGFFHAELPSDPTLEELNEIMKDIDA